MDPSTFAKLKLFFDAKPEIKIAGVFGSFAKGRSTEFSDLDIAVAAEYKLSFEEKLDLSAKLSSIMHIEIDLLDLREENFIVVGEIFRTAHWIKKTPELFAFLLSRFLNDQADFGPIYRRTIEARNRKYFLT